MSENTNLSEARELLNKCNATRNTYRAWLERTFPIGSRVSYEGLSGRFEDTVIGHTSEWAGEPTLRLRQKDEVFVVRNHVELIPAISDKELAHPL